MITAYLVATINYKTNLLVGVGIYSEPKPSSEGPFLHAIIDRYEDTTFHKAKLRLKQILDRHYPTLKLTD